MKQVSENYAALRNQTGSYYDVRLQRIVPGENNSWTYVTYGMDKLKSIEITNALYDESGPKIGGVCASQCTVKLLEQSANWPRMAQFEVQVRASSADGLTKSSWISMGTYWTDTRKADKHGNLEITAYDWMLMLEQTWYDKIATASRPTYWPITATHMASLLVEATGIQIDSRSVLENATRYIGLDNMSTAREMLSVIAAGLGGNWYITTEGKLLLVSHSSGSSDTSAIAGIAIAGKAIVGTNGSSGTPSGGGETTNVGMSVMSLEISEELPAIDSVELTNDSGVVAKAGVSSGGYTLRSRCNYADTNAAVLCLSRVYGYRYKPFAANGARLDPAAEVGDYVQIGNELFPIVTIRWRLGKHPVADISAPFDEGVDHEYPMMSEDQKTLRKAKGYANDTLTEVQAELEEITASFEIDPQEIRAKVDKVHQGEQYTFEWVLNDTAHTWYANGAEVMHVNSQGLTVAGEVKANSGFIGVTGDAFSIVPRHTDTEQDPVSGEDIQVTYPSSIQNGITKFSDEEHQGVYIGTDGIRLGPNFTVDKYGVITAKSGTIGGFTIGPNAIYSNGQSSFSGTGTGIHLSPNGIRLGDAFKVTPAGAVTASNINVTGGSITGGSINITRTEADEDTGQERTVTVFSVSANGYLNANFTGGSLQIGDKLNLNGNSLTLGGFTIGTNAIYSTDDEFSVSISPNGINLGSTFHVDNQGNAYFGGTIYAQNISGAVTQEQLAQAVQTTLGYATAYNSAIQVNTSSYPAQFTTTGLYADWLFAKQNPGQEGQYYSVKDHTHTFTEGTGANAGKIYIGSADLTGADHFFNIADTQTYIDGVSAARQTALNSVTIDRTYDEITGEVNGAYTFNGHEYVDVALLSDNTRFTTKRLNVDDLTGGIVVSVERITATRETSDVNIVWNKTSKTLSSDYTLRAWDSQTGGNVLYTESEYPITIPATKAFNAVGVFSSDELSYSSSSSDYDFDPFVSYNNVRYYDDSFGKHVDGRVDVELENGKHSRLYVQMNAQAAYDAGVADAGGGVIISSTGVTRDATHYNPYQVYVSGSVKWVIDTKAVVNGVTQNDVTALDVQDLYNMWHGSGNIDIFRIDATTYDDQHYDFDVSLANNRVEYNNGYIEGNIAATLADQSTVQTIFVSVNGSKAYQAGYEDGQASVPTPAYAKGNESLFVDEQSYDSGFYINGTSSVVAVTGYVYVDGHLINLGSHDIGVGSVWWDGYQSGGGSVAQRTVAQAFYERNEYGEIDYSHIWVRFSDGNIQGNIAVS